MQRGKCLICLSVLQKVANVIKLVSGEGSPLLIYNKLTRNNTSELPYPGLLVNSRIGIYEHDRIRQLFYCIGIIITAAAHKH